MRAKGTRLLAIGVAALLVAPLAWAQPASAKRTLRRADVTKLLQVVKGRKVMVSKAGTAKPVATNADLKIDPKAILSVQTGDKPIEVRDRASGKSLYKLPFVYAVPQWGALDRNTLQAVVEPGPGLAYDSTKNAFVGSVSVSLRHKTSTAEKKLPTSVKLRVWAEAAETDVREVVLEWANRFQDVELRAPAVQTIKFCLASPQLSNLCIPVNLQITPIRLDPSPVGIQGWGLSTSTIVIQGPPNKKVLLKVDHGVLEPLDVVLDESGTGRSKLRSSGIGTGKVSVVSVGYSGTTEVAYGFPLAFLLAAILGGVAGAGLKSRKLSLALLWGGLAGLVIAVAYMLGVNLSGRDFGRGFHEALVFAVAAFGVYWRTLKKTPAAAAKPEAEA